MVPLVKQRKPVVAGTGIGKAVADVEADRLRRLLGLPLLAYCITEPLGVPVSVVTCAGAAVLVLLAGRSRVIPICKVLIGAPWQIVLFSLGMYLVVYGYRRLHILLRREGWKVNFKRAYRIYRDEGLSIRPKLPRRKRAWRYRQGRPAIGEPNEVWAMDFMPDRLFDGRPFRILTVVGCHTPEALSLTQRANFRAYQVTEALDALGRLRGRPKSQRVDNGPELAGRMLDQWA